MLNKYKNDEEINAIAVLKFIAFSSNMSKFTLWK